MGDWLRALGVLLAAFASVVATTLVLAGAVTPEGAESAARDPATDSGTSDGGAPAPGDAGRPGIGGSLVVTGDLTGTFRLDREEIGERYALEGDDGRILVSGQPAVITQLSYEGWEFFPEPDDCSIRPLDLDSAIGVGRADVRCTDIDDIRDNGTISLQGELGFPIDMLAERTVPLTGGAVTVGDETWPIEFAYLATWQQPIIGGVTSYNMQVATPNGRRWIGFTYDVETHRLAAVALARRGEEVPIPDGACQLARAELGKPNPRTTTVEVTIDCASVEVPGLGPVPITGTIVVDELGWPE